MDVVKTNFDKLGGQIDINSQVDVGTTITIKLPLTLAIITSQVIRNQGERYAIPQVNLVELLRIPANQVKQRIERVGTADVVRLRDSLLPIVKLADVLGTDELYLDPAEVVLKKNHRRNLADRRSKKHPLFGNDRPIEPQPVKKERQERHSPDRRSHAASALNVIIVTTGAMKYGLVVDELLDSEEIVVKPLGYHLKNCGTYAGATIMGDGRVSLILDVINIARTLGLTSVEKSDRALELATELKDEPQQEKQPLLVFRNHPDQQFAIPLSQVQRLEKIRKQQIEEISGKKAMQYRQGMLPLFSIDEVVAVKPLVDQQDLLVLVLMLAGHEVGLLAANPVNSVEMSGEIDDRTHKQIGIIGSTLIDNTTTLIVNVYDIFQQINPSWFADRTAPILQDGREATILIVEDSTYFRNLVKDFLEAENYKVLEAADGHIALDILANRHQEISLIISDIEMPNLDGLSMAKAIRSQPLYNRLPIIALTTLAGDKDIARGKEAGIDDYLIKMDKENLMGAIYKLLHKELRPISP
jgi:two-component system chemotaxis sensor kinase CheA